MSFIDVTQLLDLQSTNATSDSRYAELGVSNAVKASTQFVDYILPSEKAAMASMSNLRDLQIPVLKEYTPIVVPTPGFSFIPSNLPESDQYTFQAYDVFSGFRFYPAAYRNNAVDAEYAMRENMKRVLYEMGKSIEGVYLTVLDSRKTQQLDYTTQVSQGAGTFTFSTSTDTLTVSKAAQKETMFHNLTSLMRANELDGNYRIVTSRAGLAVQKSEMLKYGANNEFNLAALGFLSMDRLHESGQISAGSDVFNGYFFRDGAIGAFENFPYDFAMGTEIAGKKWSISDTELPFLNMRANLYVNNEATDATSIITTGNDVNLKMTHFEEMAIWARFYVVYRYNSSISTRPNDIVKIVGATS